MKSNNFQTTDHQLPMPKIIGIGGTNGSGKDTLAEFLAKKHNLLFISTGDLVRQVAKLRYGNILRPTLHKVGNEIRTERGPGALVLEAQDKFKISDKSGLIIGGLRTTGEIAELKKLGGILLFVDADIKLRYERLKARKRSDDFISFEDFKAQQDFEWHQSDNPGEYSQRTVKESADIKLLNNTTQTDFFKLAEEALKAIS